MDKRLLTIQDLSCFGQCSLTVALPVISACGIETAVLPAAVLSTHTGDKFAPPVCRDLTDELPAIEKSWIDNGIKFDAFLTGYLRENQISPVLSIMESCAAPGALRIVDPAMADNGRLYRGFGADFPREMAKLCSGADCILPNPTEAALLLGEEFRPDRRDAEYFSALASRLHSLGPKHVVLTGVLCDDDRVGCAVSDGKTVGFEFHARERGCRCGTGDLFSAVFAGALLRGKELRQAVRIAGEAVARAIRATPEDHWYGLRFERVLPDILEMLK